jgi:hypothetical protein
MNILHENKKSGEYAFFSSTPTHTVSQTNYNGRFIDMMLP